MAMSRTNGKAVRETLGRDSVHPFPARMAPDLAFGIITKHSKPLRVLDPMSGSGTVLAVARANGHLAIGVDTDPLAVLISRVWTTAIDRATLRQKAAQTLATAHDVFETLRTRDAYPLNADDETKRFVRFWFDQRTRKQLASLAAAIADVRGKKIRDALWCAFSRLIISKRSGASLAMDLSHSRPHKVFTRAPTEPFSKFLLATEHVARNCIASGSGGGPPALVHEGDARSLSLPDGSIDLVLTSPPYLNAIDYIRCSKFSLVWMGHPISEMRHLRSTGIGTEVGKYEQDEDTKSILAEINPQPELSGRHEAILARYIDDMRQVIGETARVLVDGGQAVYVIGENTVRGTFIRNSLIIESLASGAGLHCISSHQRDLPANRRYLPPPSARTEALDGRMRREVVLTMQKP